MNGIVNDKKAHNIVYDSFVYKPDGLLVMCNWWLVRLPKWFNLMFEANMMNLSWHFLDGGKETSY